MTNGRTADDFLSDIVEWGTRAQSYLVGMSYEMFVADFKTRDAVTKCVEVCGEAANQAGRIDPAIPGQFPEFDIRSAYGMRNVLAHSYYSIVPRVLWSTVTESLPKFVNVAQKILATRGSGQS